ncbi:hypothetical protein V5D56_00085 (plasmid) [Cellulosimicrobium sp. PMB13]|uniref:hypothetical protein n=1 Tax=Cellulosimicrobium sp. PMB13 TaxID=3120158 RepID=UPI003F4BAAD5
MSATTPAVEAAARARRQATVVAAVGAVVPTILAAQGMASLAVDLLGFHIVAAVALASFLEVALVASALLARAAALAGRPGGADAVAVWVVSATSGLLAGVHELMNTAPDGTTTWSADPGSGLAAAVRFFAPLVAAWLWERVLQAARAEQAERTLAEVRRDRRFLAVARAALVVRRLDEAGRGSSRRARRAARRMDRAHVAALRAAPPAPTLVDVLAAVGQVDHLPAATSVAPLADETPELVAEVADRAPDVVEPVPLLADRTSHEAPDTVADAFPGARVVEDFVEEAPVADRPAVAAMPAYAAAQTRTAPVTAQVGDDAPALFPVEVAETEAEDNEPDTLALAVEVVRENPDVTGARLADELTRRGRPVSTRSGQRYRARALDALAEVPVS